MTNMDELIASMASLDLSLKAMDEAVVKLDEIIETYNDKVVSLETDRISRLPILDTNLGHLSELIQLFVNQCAHLGHHEVVGIFPVGNYQAEISLKIKEMKNE